MYDRKRRSDIFCDLAGRHHVAGYRHSKYGAWTARERTQFETWRMEWFHGLVAYYSDLFGDHVEG